MLSLLSRLLPLLFLLPPSAALASETGVLGLRMADGSLRTLVVSTAQEPRIAYGSGAWFLHNGAFWCLDLWTVQDAVTRAQLLSVRSPQALATPLPVARFDDAHDHTDQLRVLFVGGGIISMEASGYADYGGAHPLHWATLQSVSVPSLAQGAPLPVSIAAVFGESALALVGADAGLAALPAPEDAGCYEPSPLRWGIRHAAGRWQVEGARTATAHACVPARYTWTLPLAADTVAGPDALPRGVAVPPGGDVLASPSGALVVEIQEGKVRLGGAPLSLLGEDAVVEAVISVAWGQDVDWIETLPLWP